MEKIRLDTINLEDFKYEEIIFDAVVQEVAFKGATGGHPRLEIRFHSNGYIGSITRWGSVKEDAQNFLIGKVYEFTVEVGEPYKGVNSLKYVSHRDSELTPQELVAWEKGVNEAIEGVKAYLFKIQHTQIGMLTLELLKENWDKFTVYPAASSKHHKYLGGLVVHSYCVTRLCETYAEFYNKLRDDGRYDHINTNLVICGALIHDIGKLIELSFKPDNSKVEYSTESYYLTHLGYGVLMIYRKALEMGISDSPEVEELIHLVASHHGNLEWGAMIEPSSIEAVLLSMADKMDADITRFGYENKNLEIGHGLTRWENGKPNKIYKSHPEEKNLEI